MSKIVKGSFQGSSQKFDGQWLIDSKITVKLDGRFDNSVPSFVISAARLHYDDVSDLKGRYDIVDEVYASHVGVGEINLKFKNDKGIEFRITGKLDDPIDERVTVRGFYGTWS
ncbi:hypothetical protein F5887DRAFT_514461 [Amanita rubescens]|nr:hypothetical protein F5887DRAFT_514461 [Amanita rubescens]